MFAVYLTLFVLALTLCIIKSMTKPKNFPPGPKWYPLIGSSVPVQKITTKHGSQWKGLSELAKEYSTNVLGIKLGSEPVVVVYGEKNIRKAFTEKEYEGRPKDFFTKLRCLGKIIGVAFADGPLWREHRQFLAKNLRYVGFGKHEMEVEIQKEMQRIVDHIRKNNKNPINPKSFFAKSVINALWKFVAGERIEEKRLTYILDLLNARSKVFSLSGGWLNCWPWIRFLLPEMSGYKIIKQMNQQISDIVEETIIKHKKGLVKDNDFVYSFLEEIKQSRETFTEEQLKVILLDILIAGSQTTSNALEFAILKVLRDKKIQQKIYDEITDTLGDSLPSWSDSNRMVYTMAYLLEILRFFTIAPLAGPRRALNDIQIEDYVIPKETTILISLKEIHFDPNIWTEPEQFLPERFIDENGHITNTEHIYPFGMGRRRCFGVAFAKPFIFIVFVGIIQKYMIECSNGALPSEEPIIGLFSRTKPYTAKFVAR